MLIEMAICAREGADRAIITNANTNARMKRMLWMGFLLPATPRFPRIAFNALGLRGLRAAGLRTSRSASSEYSLFEGFAWRKVVFRV